MHTYREREINNLVRRADFNNDAYVQEFGLTISNSMMEVRGRVLPPPKLQYGGRVSSISGQVSIHFRPWYNMWIPYNSAMMNLMLIGSSSPYFLHRIRWVSRHQTKVFGTCAANNFSLESRFVCGRSLVSRHNAPYAKIHCAISRNNCRRFRTTLACQSSANHASVNTLLGPIKSNQCFDIWRIALTHCNWS